MAVTAASNAIGTRPDVAAIAAVAHAVGALCYVDGVHATPHVPVDVSALGADFYATSAYKWSGPHVAAVVADPALLETVWPDKLAPVVQRGAVAVRARHAAVRRPGGGDRGGRAPGRRWRPVRMPVPPPVPRAGAASRRERILASMTAVEAYEVALFARLLDGLARVEPRDPVREGRAAHADRVLHGARA